MNKIDKFDGEYAFLSNFYHHPIVDDDGIRYATNEHYFQAQKTLDLNQRRRIAAAATPGQSKHLGRTVDLRADWENIKTDVMLEALHKKFSDPILARMLLATGDAELVEGNYWHDNTWGSCSCERCQNRGENRLGKLLMQVRSELKQ
jgi:ribA/ribD-fused uncharacterized protein